MRFPVLHRVLQVTDASSTGSVRVLNHEKVIMYRIGLGIVVLLSSLPGCSKENNVDVNETNNYAQTVVCQGPAADNAMCEAAPEAPPGALCVYGYCRTPCTADIECDAVVPGSVCLPGADGSGCRIPQESRCGDGKPDCADGLVCIDGECRAPCNDDKCSLDGLTCENGACVGTALGGCVNTSSGVSISRWFGCAARDDGAGFCWGFNWTGELGNETGTTGDYEPTPVQVQGLSDAQAITTGMGLVGGSNWEGHACALRSNGTVACWGSNSSGQVGNGTSVGVWKTAKDVPSLTGVTQVDAGGLHTCAVATGGSVWCWGSNERGQLGVTGGDSNVPVEVSGVSGVVQVSGGEAHTCARTSAGAAWCWGRNDYGMVGDKTTEDRFAPVEVISDGVEWIHAGRATTCAVRAGKVWCWGWNFWGELGTMTNIGEQIANPEPSEVVGISDVVEVVATDQHTYARRQDGSVWEWGGTERDHQPKKTSSPPAVRISGDNDVFCATRADRNGWCQGGNTYGQIGNGTTQPATTPQKVLVPCQ